MYKQLTIEEIVEATHGKLVGTVSGICKTISTDSRTITKDDIFIPLRGNNFDGHSYIEEAFRKGAKLTLAQDNHKIPSNYPVLYVDDTLTAYGQIAHEYLQKFPSTKIIAITGSVGKTTVKEMITAILKTRFRVEATYKNYNNRIGVPKTILELTSEPHFIVLEMGTNSKGEMKRLVGIAPPHYSLITSIGNAHLEGFGSIDDIVQEKSEIFYGTRKEGYAFVNLDDPRIVEASTGATCKKIFYSRKEHEAPFQINSYVQNGIGWKLDARLKNENLGFRLPLLGYHNIMNALAALTVSYVVGARSEDIKAALEHFKPLDMRGEVLSFTKATVLCDCYNANPESTKAALETFKSLIKDEKGLVILGDMLELGTASAELHARMATTIIDNEFSHTVLIGNEMEYAYEVMKKKSASVDYFSSYEKAKKTLEKLIPDFHWILLKGSRGMKLERVIGDFFRE